MKLSNLIAELEREAAEGERLSRAGSPVTSIAEDHQAGAIARKIREIITRLDELTSLQ